MLALNGTMSAGGGGEEDAVMAADGYREQSTKSSNSNGGCNGDSNNDGNGNGNSDGNGNGNRVMATATTINNKGQQKKWWRSWQQQWQWNWQRRRRKLWCLQWQPLLAPVKGRGDRGSDHCCRVSTAATTISATTTWMPWSKYRRLEGLF